MLSPVFPKADCHVHANALATDWDIKRLMIKYGVGTSPYIRDDGFRKWYDHSNFHKAYDASVSLVRNPGDLYDIIKTGLIRMGRNGCIYSELLASGMNNYKGEGDPAARFAQNMREIVGAIRKAHESTGIHTFISLTAKRHLANGPAKADELLNCYESFRRTDPDDTVYITGFNMAGDEEKGNNEDFHAVFKRAKRLKLQAACHAGEVRSADDIHAALNLPGVGRIGHGLSAINDKSLMIELAERQILVEQLLTMNEKMQPQKYRTVADHPIRRFVDYGLCIGLGSDDPGMIDTDINGEYQKAQDKYGFSNEELLGFTCNSVRHAFALESVKVELLNRLGVFAREQGLAMRPNSFELAQPQFRGANLRAAFG